MFLCCLLLVTQGREARTSLEEGILSLTGVLGAHKIMASSPDMDQSTVSALRVGARWTQIGSLTLLGLGSRVKGEGQSGEQLYCRPSPLQWEKQTCHQESPGAASLPCRECSW